MQFELKVLSASQQVSSMLLTAPSREDAIEQGRRQGFIVLSAKEHVSTISGFTNRQNKFPLLLFSHELLSLLNAGLSLVDAMETLREKESRQQTKSILDQLMQALYEGLPLSGALEKLPAVFPPLYIALVRSSEKTGDLAEALRRFVEYQVQIDAVRKKVVSASIYPAILIVVGGLVILFLLLYIVPKFSVIYENKGDQLPWLSLVLLAWGRLLHEHMTFVLSGIAFLFSGATYILMLKSVRAYLGALLWKIPTVGERMRIYQLSRFYRTFGMLLNGGIPVIAAINMIKGLLPQHLESQLNLAEQDIREGIPISSAMESRGLTTPVAVRMMRVGEHTGEMGDMMERTGNFYDEEIARWIDWFTRLFEPVLMTFIGLVIGVIVILMYMPIFELAGSIQ